MIGMVSLYGKPSAASLYYHTSAVSGIVRSAQRYRGFSVSICDRFVGTIFVSWTIPEPLSTLDVKLDSDTEISIRRYGRTEGARIVLTHGSGFAADLLCPFWTLLSDEYDVVIYDLRNHGRNRVGAKKDHNLPTLVRDHDTILEAIENEYGSKPTAGVFHSISTMIALLSESKLYSALILFDPPLVKAGVNQLEMIEGAKRGAEMIRRRAHQFRNREEFVELLEFSPVFKFMPPGTHELMGRTLLRRSSSREGYELRCPREYEAQLMEYARSFFVMIDYESIACPIKIIGADPTFPHAYLPDLDQQLASSMDYDFIPETTHLLQLEKPGECAGLARDFLKQVGLE